MPGLTGILRSTEGIKIALAAGQGELWAMLEKLYAASFKDILELSRPPDPELVDLIDQAFLGGLIDGQKADLAYLWLMDNRGQLA